MTTTGIVTKAAQENLEQWASGFLKYLGAPATGPNDPRMAFLETMAIHEGVFTTTNPNNPLDITMSEGIKSGTLKGNPDGVKTFKTMGDGYVALHKFLINQGITGLLQQLTSPSATIASLTSALTDAHWEGSGSAAAVADSDSYAKAIGDSATQGVAAQAASMDAASGSDSGLGASSTPVTDAASAPKGAGTNTPIEQDAPVQPIQGMNKQYTGPGAYKGFDLQGIPADLRGQVERAIDAYTANPAEEQKMMQDIYTNYGSEAWMASIPEIRTLLVAGSYNDWEKDPAMFQSLVENTTWYKTTSDNQRLYQENVANDPAQAQKVVQEAAAQVTDVANSVGVQLSQAELTKIATTVAENSASSSGSYSSTTESTQQIYEMVVAQFNANQFMSATGANATSIAPTATSAGSSAVPTVGTGDAAALYNAFTTIARNYYLPLTPQQIANAVQAALQSDTGQGSFQTNAVANFTTQAQQQAQTLYPALSSILGTTSTSGTDNTPYAALANYRALIATYTGYQGDPDTIDLSSPQWSWILSGKAPPSGNTASGINTTLAGSAPSMSATSNGRQAPTASASPATPTLPTYDQVQSYLMSTPQFQSTDNAKTMAWQVGKAITSAFGFN